MLWWLRMTGTAKSVVVVAVNSCPCLLTRGSIRGVDFGPRAFRSCDSSRALRRSEIASELFRLPGASLTSLAERRTTDVPRLQPSTSQQRGHS